MVKKRKLVVVSLDTATSEEQICYVRAMAAHEVTGLMAHLKKDEFFELGGVGVYYEGTSQLYKEKANNEATFISPRHITDVLLRDIEITE